MSDDDNGNEVIESPVSPWIRDLVQLIVAITALVTALTAMGLNFHTRSIQQEHGEIIRENKAAVVAIEKKAEVAEEKADIAKDKAAVVEKKVEKIEGRKTDK